MSPDVRETRSPEETFELAQHLASELPDCPAYYLEGELGSGKTIFAKGLAAFYGIDPKQVASPTFALVHRYSEGRRVVYHLDLYRIEHEQEIVELGVEEMEEEGALLMIEWAEKLGRFARGDATRVRFEISGETTRKISIARPTQKGR